MFGGVDGGDVGGEFCVVGYVSKKVNGYSKRPRKLTDTQGASADDENI